jgi:hypothetical protein
MGPPTINGNQSHHCYVLIGVWLIGAPIGGGTTRPVRAVALLALQTRLAAARPPWVRIRQSAVLCGTRLFR